MKNMVAPGRARMVARHYKETEIQTASHEKIILMLHDKCLEHLMRAAALDDLVRKRVFCNKAQNILAQLQASLQGNDDVTSALFYLYDYIYLLLEKDTGQQCGRAIEIFSILRDGLHQAY